MNLALELSGRRTTSTIRLLSCKYRAECDAKANRCGMLHRQCDVTSEEMGTNLFTPDREPIVNPGKKAIKAQIGKTMHFTGIT